MHPSIGCRFALAAVTTVRLVFRIKPARAGQQWKTCSASFRRLAASILLLAIVGLDSATLRAAAPIPVTALPSTVGALESVMNLV